MRLRRIAAALAVAAVAGGGALILDTAAGSAATPAPTPISLGLTGMSSSACPLPLNGSMAVKPGTTVQFKPQLPLLSQKLTLTFVRETANSPKPTPTTKDVPNAGLNIPFASGGTYDLSWHTDLLGVLGNVIKAGATQTGKLLVNADAQKCAVAVQVPTPSVSVSGVPDPVTSTVNGVVGGVVSGVNGVLNPVNGVVGPIVGGGTSGLPIPGGGSGGGVPSPVAGGGVGTNYHPTGPTVAQRTVPQGYGNGSGVGGSYVSGGTSGSSGGVSSGSGATAGKSGSSHQQQIKSGGSPKTVQLAADKPRSALDGWSALIVLAAVLALSGATAFYARSYLLHPMPAKVQR
jgi:hypothetical protein